jgi:hypothetical protein
MKKTLAVSAILVIAVLGGCKNPDSRPTPVPTTVSPSVTISQANSAEPTPTTREPGPDKTTNKPEPTTPRTSTASTDAGTPAVQFAQRWGVKYPNVPEYAILKGANGVCAVVDQYPDWTSNPVAKDSIEEIVTGFGLNQSDAVEFAQDAEQNYCSSISNPT